MSTETIVHVAADGTIVVTAVSALALWLSRKFRYVTDMHDNHLPHIYEVLQLFAKHLGIEYIPPGLNGKK